MNTKKKQTVISFSGGKDSTAMLLLMIEKKIPVDHILFFDTGWDFPEMHEHIHRIEKYIGKSVTKLSSEKSFEFHMLEKEVHPIKEKNKARANESGIIIGKGWPNRVYR